MGGGTIRIETWLDRPSGRVVRYNLAYVNGAVCARDHGRVLGFDDSHFYPGFSSRHHVHWMGRVYENDRFVSFDQTLSRFQRWLRRLRRELGRSY